MPATLNKVFLMGNLTRDPDLRQASTGDTVANLGLAVSEQFRNRISGEVREVVTFVDVTVWGKVAENCGKYLAKGRAVFVEGRLVTDSWEDRETGKQRTRLRVRADRVQFLFSASPANGAGNAPRTGTGVPMPPAADERASVARRGQNGAYPAHAAPAPEPQPDEDLPF